MRTIRLFMTLVALVATITAHADSSVNGLRDVTVLIIRHAEKPDDGDNLSPQGEKRAIAYASYFDPFKLDGGTVTPQSLIATKDSDDSERPRLTLTPLAKQLHLPIQQPYDNDDVDSLVPYLQQNNQAKTILIAWHHGEIGDLIEDFGGDSKQLLGKRRWPKHVYNWVIVLHFDHQGLLSSSQRVVEHLLPEDDD